MSIPYKGIAQDARDIWSHYHFVGFPVSFSKTEFTFYYMELPLASGDSFDDDWHISTQSGRKQDALSSSVHQGLMFYGSMFVRPPDPHSQINPVIES